MLEGSRAQLSCACVPRSTILPCSITSISSTCSRPTSRCVISSVVRAPVTSSRSATSASAVAVSRCSPGSSRIRIGKSASRARASARRWRWPPDMRAPRSPTSVASPRGSESTQSSSRACGQRVAQLVLARVALGQAQVLFQRAVEYVHVLADQPHHAPDLVAVERVDLHAVQRHRALIREEAQQHGSERRLARAAGADERYASARAQVEVDLLKRRAACPRI